MALARCPEAAGAATNEWGVVSVRRVGDGTVSRARTAVGTTAALVSERRCDSLNPNGMDAGVPFTARRDFLGGEKKTPAAKGGWAFSLRAAGPPDVPPPLLPATHATAFAGV